MLPMPSIQTQARENGKHSPPVNEGKMDALS